MPCSPPMDAGKSSSQGKKKMSRGARKKPSSSSSSSWVAWSMGFYSSSSSDKNRAQSAAAVSAVTEGRNSDIVTDKSSKTKKMSVSISRSVACATSICSTKESSVLSRDCGGGGRSASSRSLRAPADIDVVDAVYYAAASASAAAISATSSFNSEATAATSSSSSATATTVTSSSSPLSSALSSPVSSFGSSFRGMPISRKLSGCYECHSVFDPRSFAAAAAFPCSDCGEVFGKAESLELHKATKHAVSELGPEDTSRNIVEIIFQSSWLRKQQAPVCRIGRILKVQNSDRTVKRLEQYKESIKERASGEEGNKKNARCVADGNELLRFHCTTFTCSLGFGGNALCRAPAAQCKLCAVIRDGFRVDGDGRIATMATSGRAHDMAQGISSDGEKVAMLVCRVVAGRVKKGCSDTKPSEDCDSVSPSSEGVYSDLDELFVFNPRAILPCFVVIYSGY